MYKPAYIFAAFLGLLAVLVLALQFFMPRLDFYHRVLVSQLETLSGAQIEVGDVQTTIHDFHLAVSLRQVSFSDPQRSGERAYVERLNVGVSLLNSLLQRRLVIASVALEEAALLFRHENASLRLAGVPVLPLSAQGDAPIHFEIVQSSVVWDDLVHHTQLKFAPFNLDFSSDGTEHFVSLASAMDGEDQAGISISADFKGALFSPSDWSGRLRFDTQGRVAMEPWLPFLASTMLKSAHLSFNGEAELHAGRLIAAEGFVVCDRCRQSSSWLPQSLDLSTRWQWQERADGRQTFLLEELKLDAHPVALDQVRLLMVRDAQGRRWLEVEAPQINADTIVWLNRYLPQSWPCTRPCITAQSAAVDARLQGRDHAFPIPLPWSSTKPASLSAWRLDGFAQPSSVTMNLRMKEAAFHGLLWDDYQPRFDHLSGEVQLSSGDSGSRLSLRNMQLGVRDSRLQGNLHGSFAGDRLLLDTDLSVHDWPLKAVLDVFSLRRPSPRLAKFKKWLQASLLDGKIKEGRIQLQGDPTRFPFTAGDGELHVELDLEQGVFSYHNRYPGDVNNVKAKLTMNNAAVQLAASQLDYQNMHSDYTVVKIPDIFALEVGIETRGHAALQDVLSFLHKEGVIQADGFMSQHVLVAGETDFNLSIQVPIKRLKEEGWSVQGRLRPRQAALEIPYTGAVLSDIGGELHFNQKGSLPSTMTALLNGAPVELELAPEGGFNALTLNGRLSIADLLPAMDTMISTWSEGESDWKLRLRLPPMGKSPAQAKDQYFQLNAESDLQGTGLYLPSPFAKSEQQRRAFRLAMRFNKAESRHKIAYGDRLRARLSKLADQDYYAGHVHFGKEPAHSTGDRFRITGAIRDAVDLKAWQSFLQDKADGKTHPRWRYYLSDVNVLFDRLQWGHHQWTDLIVNMRMQKNRVWVLRLHDENIKGSLYIPRPEDQVPVLVRFDRLNLQAAEATTAHQILLPDRVNPSALPPLRLELKDFSYGDVHAQKVKIQTEPAANNTMLVKHLEFRVGDLMVTTDKDKPNDWRMHHDQSTSRFSFSVHGDDMGAALRAWNVHTGISNKSSTLQGEIAWRGAPYDFSLAVLHGFIDLHLRDGVLKRVEPGVGRLFGLLSIASVARRISLDFSDLFSQGLAFDEMKGSLQFNQGTMDTRDLSIVGPAMQITISGRTGIVSRDYNQDISVVPDLSKNLPVLSSLLGGPLVGGAVYLLDYFTNLGDQINKTVTLRYKMTGSWDNSKIEFVDAPGINPRNINIFQKRSENSD